MKHLSLGHRITTTLIGLTSLLAAFPGRATCPVPSSCSITEYTDITTLPTLDLSVNVTANGSGSWDYVYTLTRTSADNTSPFFINKLYLPDFGDASITNLKVDQSFMSVQLQSTPTALTPNSIAAFTNAPPPPYMPATAAVLQFTSPFAPTASGTAQIYLTGTYRTSTSYESGYTVTHITQGVAPGTPLLQTVAIPGSPLAVAAVPEPSTAALALLGLGAIGLLSRKRARTSS